MTADIVIVNPETIEIRPSTNEAYPVLVFSPDAKVLLTDWKQLETLITAAQKALHLTINQKTQMNSTYSAKKTKNATKDRFISVLPEDCKGAICKDHQECVIARAVKRQTGAEWVDVSATTVVLKRSYESFAYRYRLGKMAREQVRFFDKTSRFAPCIICMSAVKPRHGLRKGKNARRGYQGKRKCLATR